MISLKLYNMSLGKWYQEMLHFHVFPTPTTWISTLSSCGGLRTQIPVQTKRDPTPASEHRLMLISRIHNLQMIRGNTMINHTGSVVAQDNQDRVSAVERPVEMESVRDVSLIMTATS